MEGLGGRIIAAGAIAVTSCSLLLLSYLRHKSPAKCEPEATIATEEVSLPNSGVKSQCSYSENSKSKVGKKVRFSEDVKDPSKNNEEYRKRRGRNRVGSGECISRERVLSCSSGKGRQKGMCVPENRSALYNGLSRYSSQMSILTIYSH